MRVAITGADGAVGRSLQKVLRLRAIPFRSLLSSEPPLEMARLGEYLVGDETDSDTVEALLEGMDVLVHLGRTNLPVTDDFCQEDLLGQATLIPGAQRRSIPIHYLSSSDVFTPPDAASHRAFREEDPVEPSTPLGVAKVAWEQTLRIWGEHKALQFTIYRVPLVVPEFLSYSSLMARYVRNGYREGVITPKGPGSDHRGMSHAHAEDIATILADAIVREDLAGHIFHIAADQGIREYDLAEISYRVLNDFMVPCKWNPQPPESKAGPAAGGVWLDNSKVKESFGIDLSGSVARMATKLRFWIDDFGSTARLPVAT